MAEGQSSSTSGGTHGGSGDASTSVPSNVAFLENDPDDMTCYCGKGRDMPAVEFQCSMCQRYYHSDCMTIDTEPSVPFTTNYQFFCKRCNANGQESLNKKPASFGQMCHTAVAHKLLQHPARRYFSKDKEIIPYLEQNWECLTTAPRRVNFKWHTTVSKTMMKEIEIFTCREEVPGDPHFGLVNDDLSKVGPNQDSLLRLAAANIKATEPRSTTSDTKTRGTKRKIQDNFITGGIRPKKGEVISVSKMAPQGYPVEHPFNKDGYRYILAEPDPHAPNWQAFDESIEWAGKPIPGYLYRIYLGSQVRLAMHDRAPQLKLSENRLSAVGEKGYSMIRSTHGVSRGAWYYEVTLDDMPQDTATRIGWSQQLGNLQAPCGYDKFSYSWRSRNGTKFHQSKGKHYTKSCKQKDVLGFYIYLPGPNKPEKLTPPVYKDKPLIKFKSHLYYEVKDDPAEGEKHLQVQKGSKMICYKNGKTKDVAFEDLFEGIYFPAVSLYKHSSVSVNFGPDFKYPPKDVKYRPMSEAAMASMVEHAIGDILYHIEHEGQLPEF